MLISKLLDNGDEFKLQPILTSFVSEQLAEEEETVEVTEKIPETF